MHEVSKLEAFLIRHGIKPDAVRRAIGLRSRGDFHNRMTGRLSNSGTPMRFSEEQQRRIAAFVRADISDLF